MNKITTIVAVAGLAALANGQVGNIIYTTADMTIKYYNNGSISTLHTIAASASEGLGGIDRGAGGEYYVTAGQFPVDLNNNKSAIYRVDNLFGAASHSTVKQGFPLANPTTLKYNGSNGKLVTVNNAQSEYNSANPVRGLLSVDAVSGATVTAFDQGANLAVWPRTANDLVNSPYASNQYMVACVNGGDNDFSGPDAAASTLWKFDYNTGTEQASPTLLVNFADLSATGLSEKLTLVRTVDVKAATNEVFFTDGRSGIYKAQLTVSGDWVDGSVQLLLGVSAQFPRLGGAKWNPYTDKVVFTDEVTKGMYQMNTDGSNIETLAAPGENVFGVYFIPAPGSLAMIGLAGLAAGRRRR